MVKATERKRKPGGIPAFALYGEVTRLGVDLLHIENIQARSQHVQWEIDPHLHQGLYQVLWLQGGAAEVLLDEQRQTVAAPAAVVLPPGVVHGFRFEPGTDGVVLSFSARLLLEGDLHAMGEAFRRLFASPCLLQFASSDLAAGRLHALFRELLTEFLCPGSDSSPLPGWLARAVVWRLAQALVHLQPAGHAAAGRHQALFTRFLLLVEQHFVQHWPITRYAAQLGLSVPRLNRMVQAQRGMGARELVHERLTREACRRLIYVAAPTARLSAELGFDDPAYFSRFFKRQTGVSPSHYRQQHQNP